jgi:GNAT superfamily N-acetyltransferase
MANPTSISIQPTTFADVAAIVKIGREIDATRADRHTEIKRLGNVSYLSEDDEQAKSGFVSTLQNSGKYRYIKAVNDSGKVMGSANFYFHGFGQDEIPHLDPGELDETVATQTEAEETTYEKPEEPISEEKKKATEMIDRLKDMEEEDMQRWQKILMPPGSLCIIITGLAVSPRFQHNGVGAALVKWGTNLADKFGVFMWVHSSEASYRVYAKSGFEVVGTLEIDLDAWAPAPPPMEEGEGAVWGRYVVRYMKRLPKC